MVPFADGGGGCHGARGGEGAVLASLAMLALRRVAAGGCAPSITAAARRGCGRARSGRESRVASRTREQGLAGGGGAVALGVEGDGADRGPVAGRPAPAARMALAHLLVQGMAGGEDGAVLAGMALRRGDIADAAVPVLVVVPVHEGGCPPACLGEVGKTRGGEVGAVLGRAEQRLGIGIDAPMSVKRLLRPPRCPCGEGRRSPV